MVSTVRAFESVPPTVRRVAEPRAIGCGSTGVSSRTRIEEYDSPMSLVMRLRMVSTAVSRGATISVGDPLGVDDNFVEVRERQTVVIETIDQDERGWLVAYRFLADD
jgi:hypothetical protein